MKRFGFTLAEILIVLVIIGVLTMILLPMAFQSSPDEAVLKFKKGHNTLSTVIKELVSSDKYYQNGDLGTRANGQLIDGHHDGDIKYFCETFADTLSTKSVNCSEYEAGAEELTNVDIGNDSRSYIYSVQEAGVFLDSACLKTAQNVGAEIITSDDVIFYQSNPSSTYGIISKDARAQMNQHRQDGIEYCTEENETGDCAKRWYSSPNEQPTYYDDNGFDVMYKIFCMDIDGINKGENPFGYGIRADGKIAGGARAHEWLQKSIK